MTTLLSNPQPAELQALADASLVDAIRVQAQWQQPVECEEHGGVLLVAGCNAFPVAYRNCAARSDPAVSPDAALARAAQFFAERERGFVWFVRESKDADLEGALRQRPRAKLRSDSPCMLVTERLAEPTLPLGLRLQRFEHEQHVIDAATVAAASYALLGMPAAETQALFAHPGRVLASRCTGFVVYRGSEPVATAMTVHSEGASGIYWVGTSPTAQRLGLATLCTALATNAGFDAGAQVVTLQASVMGEPVYTRMGYRTYDRLRWYSGA